MTKGPEDDAGLAGKVAIVSGGGAAGDGIGNGRAAAILLARAGTKVMVADLDLGLAERTVEMIQAEGGSAAALACDVAREAECKRLVEAAVERWGQLDFLDNNVGIGSRGSVVDEKPEEYRRVMQVNVETMFLLSKYAIPAMIETAKGGAIVNISSISALRPRGAHHLHDLEGRGDRIDPGDGGRSRPRQHPGQLHLSGSDVHADGLRPWQRHERGRPRPARQRLGAEDRRHRLGRRPCREIPAQRLRPLHHRPDAGGGWRRHAAGTGTRFTGPLGCGLINV
jgi:NAD(P)-dependent dehydrogenase (short-subunit alcohol dehydrogenase family)